MEISVIPPIAACFENIPNNRQAPMIVRPQTLTISDIVSRVGFETIICATPENIHLESKRYAADDQYGLISFDTPSYKICQPIKTLKMIRP